MQDPSYREPRKHTRGRLLWIQPIKAPARRLELSVTIHGNLDSLSSAAGSPILALDGWFCRRRLALESTSCRVDRANRSLLVLSVVATTRPILLLSSPEFPPPLHSNRT